jgi:hypothetical protein
MDTQSQTSTKGNTHILKNNAGQLTLQEAFQRLSTKQMRQL